MKSQLLDKVEHDSENYLGGRWGDNLKARLNWPTVMQKKDLMIVLLGIHSGACEDKIEDKLNTVRHINSIISFIFKFAVFNTQSKRFRQKAFRKLSQN